MSYLRLSPERIQATCSKLTRRIADRFPGSGLHGVALEISGLSAKVHKQTVVLARPNRRLRFAVSAIILTAAFAFAYVGTFLTFDRVSTNAFELAQSVEAIANTLIIAGIGFLALIRYEEQTKRRSVLKELHSLRSVIHIIDMHQLTKDPAILDADFRPTESSPPRISNPVQLSRYLEHCTELLAVAGKLAALYAQEIDDEVVVDAVNDIEQLASSLSGRIWQKIALIDTRANSPSGVHAINA